MRITSRSLVLMLIALALHLPVVTAWAQHAGEDAPLPGMTPDPNEKSVSGRLSLEPKMRKEVTLDDQGISYELEGDMESDLQAFEGKEVLVSGTIRESEGKKYINVSQYEVLAEVVKSQRSKD